MADASSTALLILGSLAPLRAQFVGNQGPGWNQMPHISLSTPNPSPDCRNMQFVVLDAKNHRIAHIHPECLTHCRGNDDSALFADLTSRLKFHVSLSILRNI